MPNSSNVADDVQVFETIRDSLADAMKTNVHDRFDSKYYLLSIAIETGCGKCDKCKEMIKRLNCFDTAFRHIDRMIETIAIQIAILILN